MKDKHPSIFQNTALVLGSAAVFVFAVAFSVFAYNVYNNPVSADTKDDYLQCSKPLDSAIDKIVEADIKSKERITVIVGKDLLDAKLRSRLEKQGNAAYTAADVTECKKLLLIAQNLLKEAGIATQGTDTQASSGDSQVSQDPTSANNFEFLSKQDYSATAITGLPPSKDCETNKVGQVVVVSKIKDFEPSGDKRVEVAVSTGGFYTKRGILQKISGNYVDKLVEGYSKSLHASEGGLDKKFAVSGLYFPNVPVESALKIQLYSPSWGDKSISLTDLPSISKSCETIFVPLWDDESYKRTGDMDVCVHSKDRSKDYSPKKTFTYPKQKEEVGKFQNENKDSIVSLGPCQDVAELVKKINAGVSLEKAVEEKKEMGIGYDPNPNSPSGPSKVDESGTKDGFVEESLNEVNKLRKLRGLSEIKFDQRVQKHAEDRLAYLVSQNACGTHANADVNPQFARDNGFSGISENVGAGSDSYSGKAAVGRYINSPDHLGNLLIPNNKFAGFAYSAGNAGGLNGYCDVQIFVQQ